MTDLRTVLGTDFTDEQLAIATHPLAPQLVVAGAGSGKTTVMAARVVHAVADLGVRPSEVLGLTFTNKAAGELTERVRRAVAALGLDLDEDEDPEPTVATYHAYAAGLVGDHALRIGREPVTQLLTEATRWQLAMRVVREAEGPFHHIDWTPAYVARYLLQLDAEMSEHLVSPFDVRAADAELIAAIENLAKPTQNLLKVASVARCRDELLDLVEAYRARKRRLDLIDYGDQVALAAEIAVRAPEVGAIERSRYRLVILDEYQDTGVAQRILLSSLFGGGHPVTAVGDPCQAIYGWRGASVGNLIRFPEHFPPATSAHLRTSFRSGGLVLEVANKLSEALRFDVPVLQPVPERQAAGEVRCGFFRDVLREADWIADSIAAAVDAGTPPGECAVLCRRRADFPLLFAKLVDRGLPVEVVGLGGLLEMPEVADVVAMLRVLADAGANAALLRVLTGARWRIGPRDLAALGRRAKDLTRGDRPSDPLRAAARGVDPCDVVSLADAIDDPGELAAYSPEAAARLGQLAEELRRLRPLVAQPVVEAVAEVVRAIGLDVEIEAAPEPVAVARAGNLSAFMDAAAHFAGIEGDSDLTAFLAYLDAASDAENDLDAGGVSGADTVKLLTVHKAKGLEWDVVAVPGLCSDVFPSHRGRPRWTGAARALPYALRGDAEDLPPAPAWTSGALKEFEDACRAEDKTEERRLAYVAVTRARNLLLASGYRWGGTQSRPKSSSPFLDEIAELGRVVEWTDDTSDENPLSSRTTDVGWPAPYEPAALERRRAAAELVRSAAGPAGGEWAEEAAVLVAELREVDAPERLVPLPRRLTATQVVQLSADPEALARELARPLPRKPRPEARRGTRFHAWVESLFEQRALLDPDEVPGAADEEVRDEAELAEMQLSFLMSEYAARQPVAVEAPFELVVGGRLVRGRIDAVYDDGDGTYDVVDFKTGRVPADLTSAALQLSCYRLAWAAIRGISPERVRAGFFYVRTGEVVRPPVLDEDELSALVNA